MATINTESLITRQFFEPTADTKSPLVEALTGAIQGVRREKKDKILRDSITASLAGTATAEQQGIMFQVSPEKALKVLEGAGAISAQGREKLANTAFRIQNMQDPAQQTAAIENVIQQMQSGGSDPSLWMNMLQGNPQQRNQELTGIQQAVLSVKERGAAGLAQQKFGLDQQRVGIQQQAANTQSRSVASQIAERGKPTEATTAQRDFADLTKNLTPEQKAQARLIKLGLSPRAVGNAIQTISAQGLAEQIGDVKAIIKEREKFGELTGASRSKTIDKAFDTIRKIDRNVLNLDRAISAVEAGAGTGAIERRFPSIKAASVLLDNIQGELALDVIGAVTFGALSAGELDLAKQIALPTGLNGAQLIKHLRDKKTAQEKLRGYFNEQVQFLDQGGSVAGFLRHKERGGVVNPTLQKQQEAPDSIGTATVTPVNVIKFDRTGKRIQ